MCTWGLWEHVKTENDIGPFKTRMPGGGANGYFKSLQQSNRTACPRPDQHFVGPMRSYDVKDGSFDAEGYSPLICANFT
jgi:hypothetical protein